jgi:hypothetical protein
LIGDDAESSVGRLTVEGTTSGEMWRSSGEKRPRGSASASSASGVRTWELPSFAIAIGSFAPHELCWLVVASCCSQAAEGLLVAGGIQQDHPEGVVLRPGCAGLPLLAGSGRPSERIGHPEDEVVQRAAVDAVVRPPIGGHFTAYGDPEVMKSELLRQ